MTTKKTKPKTKNKTKTPAPTPKSANNFHPGDLAVYPAHGVGRIESIESREIGKDIQDFYIMKIFETNMVIMIPVKNLDTVGVRDIIAKKEIPKIYEVIKQQDEITPLDNQTWNRRYKDYMDKIKTGSLYGVAEVFRDLFLLKLTKDLSFGERKLLDIAQNLLVSELSIAKGTEETSIFSEIKSFFPSTQPQHAGG